MANKVHMTIHVPGGIIDPLDYFWVVFRREIGLISDDFEHVVQLRAVNAWRIAKSLGYAAEKAISLSPTKRKHHLILAVNNCYWGGPDGMWEELFDDADVEFSYEVKPMPGEVTDDKEEFDAA